MANIVHKQLLNIANTTAGAGAGWSMMWAATRIAKSCGWKYAGSSDSVTKDASGDPALDFWNNTPGVVGTLTTSGSGAVVEAPSRGRALVTGLTGITSGMKGQFLKITGSTVTANNNVHQIEEFVSSTSVKIDARNFAVGADAVGRSWEVRNPLLDVYPSGLTAAGFAWWCGVGPHTLRIPITSYPVGRFVRGERIVQATTGFEGEFRDLVWNSATSAGYLVAFGQVRGTGVAAYGLTTALVITGQTSGATVTQVGTTKEFRAEMVISKGGTDITGNISFGVFDTATDVRFSALVSSVDCTETSYPGSGSGGTNDFPTYAWNAWGDAGFSSGGAWVGSTGGTQDTQNAFAVCADGIEEAGYSADGSWTVGTLLRNGNAWSCFGFHVLEGGDADLAPWVSFTPAGTQQTVQILTDTNRKSTPVYTFSNQYLTSTQAYDEDNFSKKLDNSLRGWVRRGWGGASDRWTPLHGSQPAPLTGELSWARTYDTSVFTDPNSSRRAESMNVPGQSILMPYLIGMWWSQAGSLFTTRKIVKGTARWLKLIDNGHMGTLHDQGLFYQLAGVMVNLACGPFNGVAPTIQGTRLYLQVNSSATRANSGGQQEAIDGTVLSHAAIPADPGVSNWTNQLQTVSTMSAQTSLTRHRSMLKLNQAPSGHPKTATAGTRGQLRYYSPPLAAQTISGTVKGQVMAQESLIGSDCYTAARLYVMGQDGTVRGVLRELLPQATITGGLEFATTTTNRKIFRNGTLTSVVCLDGDQLVFELGWRCGATTGTAGFVITNKGIADLPEDETTTTTGLNSWIEFSSGIQYLDTLPSTEISSGVDRGGSGATVVAPPPATTVYNRVYHSGDGKFVVWVTATPDTGGASYPGPGAFGEATSDYVVLDSCPDN